MSSAEDHTRTPGGSKEGNVDANKCNLGGDSCVVMLILSSRSNTHDPNYKLADQHAQCTVYEDFATSESLNGIERDRSAADVDERGNNTDQEWIADSL